MTITNDDEVDNKDSPIFLMSDQVQNEWRALSSYVYQIPKCDENTHLILSWPPIGRLRTLIENNDKQQKYCANLNDFYWVFE